MKDLKFANESLLFWLCSLTDDRRPKYSPFIIHLPDFANLEVFHYALSGYGIQIRKF